MELVVVVGCDLCCVYHGELSSLVSGVENFCP